MTPNRSTTPPIQKWAACKAVAQPNIALVKYWGKKNIPGNIPAVGSLSITLEALRTETTVCFDPRLVSDVFILNGEPNPSGLGKVSRSLDLLREEAGTTCRAHVTSENNFPTAAGLASSASGFAALVTAAGKALGLDVSLARYADWARQGSASAARSIYGGFVEMRLISQKRRTQVITEPLLNAEAWPLEVVVAVTSTQMKAVSSSAGMELTRLTSPYYARWVASQEQDLQEAREAILARDFERLALVSEQSCLKMHGLAMASRPGLIYWGAATVSCLHAIRDLRAQGCPVFYTVDAGPQIKAICEPKATTEVARTLQSIPGVQQVITTRLGAGARLL